MVVLSKEDRDLWERYTANVNELRLNTTTINDLSVEKKLISQFKKKQIKINFKTNNFEKFQKLLKKGKVEPDGIIDLHGFNLIEAKKKLMLYIFDAFNNNRRNILIITGKGLNNKGLLKKEVPIWLNESELKKILISYKSAPKSFGGEGALIVRLRNKNKV